MGWLGWTERQALAADVNAILAGYDGRLDLFETIGWIERKAPEPKARDLPTLTPGMFRAMFG